jgi:hypothetical protein
MTLSLRKIEEAAREATPGPWILATSNSWRRFVTRDRMTPVCEPITQNDGHPDLHFRNGGEQGPDATLIAAMSPEAVLALVAVVEAAIAWKTSPNWVCEKALREALNGIEE